MLGCDLSETVKTVPYDLSYHARLYLRVDVGIDPYGGGGCCVCNLRGLQPTPQFFAMQKTAPLTQGSLWCIISGCVVI